MFQITTSTVRRTIPGSVLRLTEDAAVRDLLQAPVLEIIRASGAPLSENSQQAIASASLSIVAAEIAEGLTTDTEGLLECLAIELTLLIDVSLDGRYSPLTDAVASGIVE